MNFLVRKLPRDLPAFIHKEILANLYRVTADAFECPAHAHYHLSNVERLLAYALFTKERAEKAFQYGCDVQTIKTRLYQNAFPLGRRLRKWFAVDTMEEVMALGQILYRVIEVDIQGIPRETLL